MHTCDIYKQPERSAQAHEHPVAHLPLRGAHSLCQIGFRIEGTLRCKNSVEIESSKYSIGFGAQNHVSGFRFSPPEGSAQAHKYSVAHLPLCGAHSLYTMGIMFQDLGMRSNMS